VCYVLNDSEFFGASLRSIYDHVSGVTVVTRYDRDRFGNARAPDGLLDMVLSRQYDPDRKVNLIVTSEGSEPRGRNRGMAFASALPRVTATSALRARSLASRPVRCLMVSNS